MTLLENVVAYFFWAIVYSGVAYLSDLPVADILAHVIFSGQIWALVLFINRS